MKHLLTFLRHDVSGTLASTVCSPSFDRRGTMLKHYAFMLLFLLGSVNVWGTSPVQSTFSKNSTISNNQVTEGGVTWTINTGTKTGSPAAPAGANFQKSTGLKFGESGSKYYKPVTFTTSYFDDYNVTAVEVYICNNGNKAGTLTVTQGSTQIGTQTETFGTTWTVLKAETQSGNGGALSISYSVDQAFCINYIKVTYTGSSKPTTCAEPTFSPVAGAVVSGTTVALTTTTEDADIYYTMGDSPADPTTSSTKYTAPISITEATTIKAIAVKEGMDNSAVASAAYTIATPYTSIADLADAMTGADQSVYVTFGGWQVSVVKNSQAFVTDGTNGLIIYQSGHGLAEGDILTGTVQCTLVSFNGVVELKGVTKTMDGIVVNSGTISPVVKTIAEANDLTALNTGLLIKLEDVTYNGTAFVDAGSNTIAPYNTFYSYSLTSGQKYNVTGIVQQYQSNTQIYPRKGADIEEIIEAGAPNAPTFSVAGGTYTSVQSVELSCATEGAVVYYTTNGNTPDNTSTLYSSPIEVGENMTIKAIAIKDEKESTVVTAEYTINLPENEEVRKTWDLRIASYSANSANQVTWSATYVAMVVDKEDASTNANSYLGGDANNRTSSRFYKDSKLTITPNNKSLTTIVFTATSDSYATALANSAWTNATAAASGTTVTVTATDGDAAVSAVIGGICGFTAVQVNYITDTRVAAGLTWSTDAVEITLGELFSAPTLHNPNSIAAGEITIESNNTALATVAGGVVSLVKNATGTATITASFAGNVSYKATEVSYTIKVNKPLSSWASVYTSNVTLSTEGGTSASAAKVIFDETEGGYDAIKAGTGSVSGAVKITVPAQATTLHYHAYGWNGEDVTLSITAPTGVTINPVSQTISSNSGVSSNSPFTLKNNPDPKNDAYYSVDLSGNDEEIELTFTATTGNRFVLFGVNQEGGLVPELQSIAISGDLTNKTGYKAGDALDMTGLTVKATYTLGGTPQTPVDITDDAELEWSYAPLVENQTSVTITATYKGQTDDITIDDLEAVVSADPKIYVDKLNVNFGTVAKDAVVTDQTLTVTLTNVAAATVEITGEGAAAFSATPMTLTESRTIVVSASSDNQGTFSATLTISDDANGAESKDISLSLTVTEPVVEETAVSTTSKWVAATEADLVDGAEVLITGVKSEVTYAMSVKSSNGNNRTSVAGTLDEGVFTPGENTMSFFLEANGENFYIKTSNGKYLYNASSSGSSYLKTKDDSEDASWTITIDGDNNAVITSVENKNRTLMRFNLNGTSNPLFNCYASGQQPVKLYVPQPVTPPTPVLTEVRTGLTAGNYYTMCLEKAVTDVRGGSIWRVLSKAQNTLDIILEEVDGTLDAGRPYIFFATADKLEVVYEGAAVGAPITTGNNGLVGSFEKKLIAQAATNYIIYNNALYFVNSDNVYVGAHRAYLDMTGVPPYSNEPQQGNAPRRRVTMAVHGEQVATGMENVQGDNVQCTKVLINGQLFIIRGEKMYDAKGQLVK